MPEVCRVVDGPEVDAPECGKPALYRVYPARANGRHVPMCKDHWTPGNEKHSAIERVETINAPA